MPSDSENPVIMMIRHMISFPWNGSLFPHQVGRPALHYGLCDPVLCRDALACATSQWNVMARPSRKRRTRSGRSAPIELKRPRVEELERATQLSGGDAIVPTLGMYLVGNPADRGAQE